MSALFGSTRAIPAPKSPPLGMDSDLAPTNYQSRPVPYLAGTRRIGVTWISQAFDVIVTDAAAAGGSKKAGSSSAKDYTASAAGLLCHGPADVISQIWFDNQLAWEGSLVRTSGDYVDVTIEDRGVMRLYWGTATQDRDPDLEDLETATDPAAVELHPAYRGFAYVVFKGLYLGTSRTQFPQVEIVLSRWPAPGWLGVSGNLQGDANPVAILWDWICNARLGGGFPEARLNTSTLATVAAALDAECAGVSPYLTAARSMRQHIAELCEYIDAFPRATPAGLLELGLVRSTCVTTPLWDESDLTEEPRVNAGDWSEVSTMAVVRYTNRLNAHKEDAVMVEDLGAAQVLGASKVNTLERRWITRPAQAWVVAQAEARAAGVPPMTGSLKVRRSRAAGVRQGDQFRLSWAQWGVCNLPCRVVTITVPPPDKPECDVTWIADRGHLSVLLAPPPAYVAPPRLIRGPVPFVYARIIEMPCALTPSPDSIGDAWRPFLYPPLPEGEPAIKRAVSFLVARPSSVIDSWSAHYRLESGSYVESGTSRRFAMRGTLTASIIDTDTDPSVEFTGIDITPPDAFEPGAYALIIGDEWCQVTEIGTLSGPATYPLTVVRGAADTTPLTYGSGTEVWLVEISSLLIVTALAAGPDHIFKLAPAVMAARLPLADAEPQTISLVLSCPV